MRFWQRYTYRPFLLSRLSSESERVETLALGLWRLPSALPPVPPSMLGLWGMSESDRIKPRQAVDESLRFTETVPARKPINSPPQP